MSALEQWSTHKDNVRFSLPPFSGHQMTTIMDAADAALSAVVGGLEKAEQHWHREEANANRLSRELERAEAEVERLKEMLHVAYQRSGQAWNWPEDEWMENLKKERTP